MLLQTGGLKIAHLISTHILRTKISKHIMNSVSFYQLGWNSSSPLHKVNNSPEARLASYAVGSDGRWTLKPFVAEVNNSCNRPRRCDSAVDLYFR